jgi:hypothetical protein
MMFNHKRYIYTVFGYLTDHKRHHPCYFNRIFKRNGLMLLLTI